MQIGTIYDRLTKPVTDVLKLQRDHADLLKVSETDVTIRNILSFQLTVSPLNSPAVSSSVSSSGSSNSSSSSSSGNSSSSNDEV